MALSANTVWEVRTAGADTNGGGFVTGASGTDFSQQNAKNTVGNNISTTDAVGNGTTTLTSATASWTSAIVGSIIYLQGGTGSLAAVWRQVVTFTNSTTVVLDLAVAAGTGITMNIGGALASPGMVGASIVAGNSLYVKSGTYSITSASSNVSGGCFSSAAATLHIEGYGSSRGDFGTPPLLQASGISTAVLLTATGNPSSIINITADGATLTSIRGIVAGSGGFGYKLLGKNCTNNGLMNAGATGALVACSATGCSTQPAISAGACFSCESYSNSSSGFTLVSNSVLTNCLSYANSGGSSHGFNFSLTGMFCRNCTAYGNGADGFHIASGQAGNVFVNCLAEANTGFGFNAAAAVRLVNCGAYNNTGGNTSLTSTVVDQNIGFITGTASFFVNPGSGNLALNTNAGGGGLARAAGIPGIFPAGTTTGYLDLGAAQHPDPPAFSAVIVGSSVGRSATI